MRDAAFEKGCYLRNKVRWPVIIILAIPWPPTLTYGFYRWWIGDFLGFLLLTAMVCSYAFIVLYAELIFRPKSVLIEDNGYSFQFRPFRKRMIGFDHVKGINLIKGDEGKFNRRLWSGHFFYSQSAIVDTFIVTESKLHSLYEHQSPPLKRIVMSYDLAQSLKDDFLSNNRNKKVE